MVYCDSYMSVVIASIAEVGHDGEMSLFITHRSGTRNQTAYETPEALLKAYQLIQEMLVQYNTGKTIADHIKQGSIAEAKEESPKGEAEGLKVVNKK